MMYATQFSADEQFQPTAEDWAEFGQWAADVDGAADVDAINTAFQDDMMECLEHEETEFPMERRSAA